MTVVSVPMVVGASSSGTPSCGASSSGTPPYSTSPTSSSGTPPYSTSPTSSYSHKVTDPDAPTLISASAPPVSVTSSSHPTL